MKSSTIRRSTLSKETMDVIETLSKEQDIDDRVNEYVREEEDYQEKNSDIVNKAQEIDLLWQNFKSTQLNTKSPTAYVTMGFVAGVIISLLCVWTMGTYMIKTGKMSLNRTKTYTTTVQEQMQEEAVSAEEEKLQEAAAANETEENVSENQPAVQIPAETPVDTSKMKKYVVKNGDTGESIIKHFYGAYTPERAEKIIKANNLKNLDRINIDQELFIPVE